MITKYKNKVLPLIVLAFLVAVLGFVYFLRSPHATSISLNKPSEESFLAPGKDWKSQKKVEDYFVEHLHMSPQEAIDSRSVSKGNDGKVNLRLTQGSTLSALVSNLEYYGFVRDQKSLEYALENSVDTVPGQANPIKVGNNTIDLWASYRISEDMTAWEIADQLLNHPSYFAYDEYGYMFMP
jgi:hypothetical protein